MFLKRIRRKSVALLFLLLPACGMVARCSTPAPLDEAAFQALYASPLPAPETSLNVYHLGHSLVGNDMPTMLRQMANAAQGEGHSYASQLGWGANLREHWEPDVPVNGFEESNQHPQFRDPHEAMASGEYDAVVLTETVEIRDSIEYQDAQGYLHKWANAAWDGNSQARVYLYETWHKLDDEEGWRTRLDLDLGRYWEAEILRRAMANDTPPRAIHVVPGGQVMAAFARRLEAEGGIGPLNTHEDLFKDHIHFNDYGAYLVALTHYAVLYGRSPVGLPHTLLKANGDPAEDPGAEAARAMQETVWEVVTSYPPSGVAQGN